MKPSWSNILHNSFVHILLIAVVGFTAYSNTFNVPFQFDDKANIVNNPIVKNLRYFLDTEKAKKYTGTNEYPDLKKRYIGHLTFALNHKLHGFDVRGYHVVNILIHILSSVLFYLLVLLLFRTPFMEGSFLKEHSDFIALFSALLFVSHPVQTQAVTYIVQRLSSLATMFYLLSLVLFVKFRLRSTHYASRLVARKGYFSSILLYILSLISAVMAMKTKEIAFTLPLTIVLFEFMFFRDKTARRILYLIPLLLTLLIIPLTYVGLYSNMDKPVADIIADTDAATTVKKIPRGDYLLTQLRVIITYLRLLAVPVGQNLDYNYPTYDSLFAPQVLLSFLFLLALICLGVYLFYRSRTENTELRLISFGIFWFFITLSVESSIVPLYLIFEHRVYLPSIGFFIAIVTAIFMLIKNQTAKKVATGAFVLILIVFITTTYARNTVWKSAINLWEDVVSKSPQSVIGHNNLGNAYLLNDMDEEAIKHYLIALEAKPVTKPRYIYYAEIQYNLANAYKTAALPDKAIEHYHKSLNINFNNLDALNNLGVVYFSKGMIQKALSCYQSAIEIDPSYAQAHYNIGDAYFSLGWLDKAIEHYGAFLRLRPNHKEAHYNIALAYKKMGLDQKADVHFQQAKSLKKQ